MKKTLIFLLILSVVLTACSNTASSDKELPETCKSWDPGSCKMLCKAYYFDDGECKYYEGSCCSIPFYTLGECEQTCTNKEIKKEFLNDESYCETDNDCHWIDQGCCGMVANKYHEQINNIDYWMDCSVVKCATHNVYDLKCEENKCENVPKNQVQIDKLCETDNDCGCGRHTQTGECFFGNKDYVDTDNQCPDFCSGITGTLKIECNNNECVQKMTEDIRDNCASDSDCNYIDYMDECHTSQYVYEINKQNDELGIQVDRARSRDNVMCSCKEQRCAEELII